MSESARAAPAVRVRTLGRGDRPRRILVTTDAVGGVWSFSVELVRGLVRSGIDVVLAILAGPLRAEQRLELGQLPGLAVAESTWRLEWMDEPWRDVRDSGEWLLDVGREFSVDLVHLNGYCHAALPWSAPVVVAGHSCVVSWWWAVHAQAPPPRLDRYRREVAAGLSAADAVVAPSRAMAAELERHYGVAAPVTVVPNGVSAAGWHPGPKEPFVVGAGRLWDAGKNLAALDRIAPRIPWPVFVAGESRRPGGTPETHANVRSLGVLERRDLRRLLSRASILVHPARYEPFGLVPLEAARCGCALILGDLASLREIWGATAVYVPPDDDDAIARAVASLIEDPPRRAALATAARERAQVYRAETMTEAYLDLYRRVLRRAGSESRVPAFDVSDA